MNRRNFAGQAGFDAVELAPFDAITASAECGASRELIDQSIEGTRAVRQAVGDKIDILIDVHSRPDVEQGIDLSRTSTGWRWCRARRPAKC